MSDILRDFDKKNEFPKVSIDRMKIGGKELAEELANNILNGKFDLGIEKIAKDIVKRQDNAMAMEFTKRIGELLKNNGVFPEITEYKNENMKENSIEHRYSVTIDKLDFSEHDKVFEDKIAELKKDYNTASELLGKYQQENEALKKRIQELDTIDAMRNAEKRELKQRIAELESKKMETCENELISDDCRPSMEWYDNRHQSDCIEINRLNTTIDVLIHKVEYLRQFAGLE